MTNHVLPVTDIEVEVELYFLKLRVESEIPLRVTAITPSLFTATFTVCCAKMHTKYPRMSFYHEIMWVIPRNTKQYRPIFLMCFDLRR